MKVWKPYEGLYLYIVLFTVLLDLL